MLGFMAVSGILGWLNIRSLDVQLAFADEIYAGRDTLVTVRLTNRKRWLPSFLLRIRLGAVHADFTFLNRSSTATDSLILSFPERGVHNIAAADICSPFPVNFFVRCNRYKIENSCTVFPAPLYAHGGGVADRTGKGGGMPLPRKGYEGDVTKIVDYTGGEPLKMIHWRLSAKYGLLKVKEMAEAALEPLILDPASLPGETLEARISSAAFLVNRLIRADRPVGLRVGQRIIGPARSRPHRLRLLAELAVYGKD